ncbi:MAG: TetR/AcrR family transcriptional regulator [Cellulosilyticaceae bacterium]
MPNTLQELMHTYGCPMAHQKLSPKQLAILDAALELFSAKGYTATTTLEIAQKAHTTEKTLFKYFPTKQILFNHIFYPCLMNMLEQPAPIATLPDDTLYHILHTLFTEKIALSDENPELFKLLIHQIFRDEKFRQVFYQYWTTLYTPYLEKHIDPAHSQSVSRIIFSMMIGYTLSKNLLAPNLSYDDDKEINLMLSILFEGINHFT